MLNQFLQFIKKHALITKNDKLLLAVSGGLDSMVLLHLCAQANFNLKVAHCNFGLRGEESDQDAQFVSAVTSKMEFDYFERKFETKEFAVANGISTQMAARALRYQWFDEIIKEHGLHKLVVGQHLDDNIETVLLNLIRGTSIAGLRGIKPISGHVIRPLLDFQRSEIELFALKNNIRWREDSSNNSDDYKRNFVRHNLIPLLPKLNQGYHDTFKRTIEKNVEVEAVFNHRIDALKSLLKKEKGVVSIDKERLVNEKVGPLQLLELISDFGFNFDQSSEVLNALEGLSGKQFLSTTHSMTIDRDYLFIQEINETASLPLEIYQDDLAVSIDAVQYAILLENTPLSFERNSLMAVLDFSKLSFPLKVRAITEGDFFYPLGMKGRKKLSDFMIDQKIPLNLKSRIHVLTSGKDIVWVVGHRVDDRYKVSNETKQFFQIKPIEPNV
ncbi:MAG: tRNA(Ile)-lysidine synthase [Roseivirga sp.]|jgi:tRNA(Ile)-lysidine synthase